MDEIFKTRRALLKQLIQEHGDARRLSIHLGMTEARISQLKGNPGRLGQMSEKVARKIEATLGLSPRWLDDRTNLRVRVQQELNESLLARASEAVEARLRTARVKLPDVKRRALITRFYQRTAEKGEVDLPYLDSELRILLSK